MSLWEAVAVALALAYLLLAMRRSLWCWPAALVSTLIYTVLFWHVALLMDSLLNVYYMAMAGYGFWVWRGGPTPEDNQPIVRWPWQRHVSLILITSVLTLACGYILARYSHDPMPYLDSATTCFAVITTYMVARKELYNWVYWIVIDLVSVYLYIAKDLPLTAALSVLYVMLCVIGYIDWRRALLHQQVMDEEQQYA